VTADSREPQHFIDFVREKRNALRTRPLAVVSAASFCLLLPKSNSLAQKRTPLQTIDFLPGYETVNVIAELEPGSCTGRYAHPGAESAYVLEGAAVAKFDGKSDLILKAGQPLQFDRVLRDIRRIAATERDWFAWRLFSWRAVRSVKLRTVRALRLPTRGPVMLRLVKVAVSFAAFAFLLIVEGTLDAHADSKLPDPLNAGVAQQLFRLDCGRSLANDESVWTPGQNVGVSIEFSSTCWLIRHGSECLLWDTGVPEAAFSDPRGWSTLPKLIVYHLDKTLTDQLAEIGLKRDDIARVAISHTHGDHIGNVSLFPNSTILMQRAEYSWIHSPDGSNDNVNQLMALARKLLGTPKNLQLIDGDTDVFGDGSVILVSTPGHTPGSQSLLVHLKNSGFIILSGDVVHLEGNFEKSIVPSLNTNRGESIASMEKIRRLIGIYKATLFINHDKRQSDKLKLLPAFYD
jgi:N-acyl homoserine lactone hydrolase